MKKTNGTTIIKRLSGLLKELELQLDVKTTSLNKKKTRYKNRGYWSDFKVLGRPVKSEFIRIFQDFGTRKSFAFSIQNFDGEECVVVTAVERGKDGKKNYLLVSQPYKESEFKRLLKSFINDTKGKSHWLLSLKAHFKPLSNDDPEFVSAHEQFIDKFGGKIANSVKAADDAERLSVFVPELVEKINEEVKDTPAYRDVKAIEKELEAVKARLVKARARLDSIKANSGKELTGGLDYGELKFQLDEAKSHVATLPYHFSDIEEYLASLPVSISARIRQTHPILDLAKEQIK